MRFPADPSTSVEPLAWKLHFDQGVRLQRQGRLAEAAASYRRAIAYQPGCAEAHNNLGDVLLTLGRLEEAAGHLWRAHQLKPASGRILYNLVHLRRLGPGDPLVADVEGLLADPATADAERIHLCFALGKAYDDLGRHAEAFDLWSQGNRRKRACLAFDFAAVQAFFDELCAAPGPAPRAGCGSPSKVPILIVGMPRSGTSLVEQILASHPMVHGAGESPALGELVEDLPRRLALDAGYRDCVAALSCADRTGLAEDYVERLRAGHEEAARVCDKALGNFLHLGLVACILPNAVLVHCRRHPLATCLSCYSTLFSGDAVAFSYDLDELGRYYALYDRLMSHWKRSLPAPIHEVEYERLVTDPWPCVRQLLAACGLPWDDRCLEFHRNPRPLSTASRLQVRKPLYRGSLDRWRAYERHLEPLARHLRSREGLA